MVGDKLLHELVNGCFVAAVDLEIFLGGKHDIFHRLNLGGRSGQTNLLGIGFDEIGAPFLDGQSGAGFEEGVGPLIGGFGFGGGEGIFETLEQLGVAGAALSG